MTNFKILVLLTLSLQVIHFGYSQDKHLSSVKGESSIGFGIGLPYGAIGVRVGTNIADGLNLFAGIGYHIAGLGYNVGLLKEFAGTGMTQFYFTGMYGTNSAIKVEGLSEYNKVYTGATFGTGIKMNSRRKEGNYWDIGLLIPIRSTKYKDDETALKNDPRVADVSSPWPVLIVLGYNFNL